MKKYNTAKTAKLRLTLSNLKHNEDARKHDVGQSIALSAGSMDDLAAFLAAFCSGVSEAEESGFSTKECA
jgi:hypothetical protein